MKSNVLLSDCRMTTEVAARAHRAWPRHQRALLVDASMRVPRVVGVSACGLLFGFVRLLQDM
jgi:hypothetical protein